VSPGTRWAAAFTRQTVLPRGPIARACDLFATPAVRSRVSKVLRTLAIRCEAARPRTNATTRSRDHHLTDPEPSARQPHRLDLQDPIAFRIPFLPVRLTIGFSRGAS
jgi:hypothetical protein